MKHHGHHRHRHRKSKQLMIAIALMVVCAIIAAGTIWCLRHFKPEIVEEVYGNLDERFASSLVIHHDGREREYRQYAMTNVLVIGIDQQSMGAVPANSLFRSGGQADFLLLLSIDRERKQITPIQLDRDTITPIDILGIFGNPAGTHLTHLCLAQVYGETREDQCENTVSAVERLLNGVPVTYYLAMDLSGIDILNDAMGGVTVTIDEDLSYLDPAFAAGKTVHLNGHQAETFVRSRMSVVSDPTNAGRMRRQRTYMEAAANHLIMQSKTDPEFVLHVFEQMEGHITTDIPQGWLINDLPTILDYDLAPIYVPAGEHGRDSKGFTAFYPDENALLENELRLFFK